MNTFAITAKDKHACALRELRMRERVYPRWIADGRITQDKADREMAVMKAIVEDYMDQEDIEEDPKLL